MRAARKSKWLGLAGFALSLLVVWGLSAAVLHSTLQPTHPDELRFSSARRVLYYRVGAGESVFADLPTNAHALKLLTHLKLSEGTKYAPDRQYLYGVRAELLDAEGATLGEETVFTRSRQSQSHVRDPGLPIQRSFTVNADEEITDVRELFMDIPAEFVGRATQVRLTGTGAPGALLVRAFGRSPTRLPRVRPMPAAEELEELTYLPADKLPLDGGVEQTSLWERLSLQTGNNSECATQAVFRTDFQRSYRDAEREVSEQLVPGRALSFNVEGPTTLSLELWRGRGAGRSEAMPVLLRSLSAEGMADLQQFTPPTAGELRAEQVVVGAGLHTLELENPLEGGARELSFQLQAPGGVRWRGTTAEPGPLKPDFVAERVWPSGPSCEPLEFELPADATDEARALRLDARVLATDPRRLSAAELRFESFAADGTKNGEGAVPVEAFASRFDVVEAAALPEGALPCGATQGGQTYAERPLAVAEPSTVRLLVEKGTTRVRFFGTAPLVLSVSQWLARPEGMKHAPPFDDSALVGVRWRHAPLEARVWHPLRPKNHAALGQQAGALTLRGQTRLELAGAGGESVSGPARSLTPLGRPTEREVLEPATPSVAVGRALTRTLFSRLAVEGFRNSRFFARTPSRPELRVEAPASALGQRVEVTVDGRRVSRFVLRSTRERRLLPAIAPGDHAIGLKTAAKDVEALVNRESVGGESLAIRTVYRFGKGGLKLRVPKPGSEPVTVNVVLYGATAEPLPSDVVAVKIDGGKPRRRSHALVERMTSPSRHVAPPASKRGPVEIGGTGLYARSFSVTLGDDLLPGTHEVELLPDGAGNFRWARFFVFDATGSAKPIQQWNRAAATGSEPGTGGGAP